MSEEVEVKIFEETPVEERLEKIRKKIIKDAEKQASEILSEARERAAKVVEEAEKRAERRASEILRREAEEAEREKRKIIAEAKLRARQVVTASKEEGIRREILSSYPLETSLTASINELKIISGLCSAFPKASFSKGNSFCIRAKILPSLSIIPLFIFVVPKSTAKTKSFSMAISPIHLYL